MKFDLAPKSLVPAFLMIAGGSLATTMAASAMQRFWAYRTLEAKLCYVLILLSGVALLAGGAICLLFAGYRRAASGVGAVAGSVFAMTLFIGVLSRAIPCSGPM